MLKDVVRGRLFWAIEERIWVRREHNRPGWRNGWQRLPIKSLSTSKDHILRRDIRVEKKGEEEKSLIFDFEKLLIVYLEKRGWKILILDFERE